MLAAAQRGTPNTQPTSGASQQTSSAQVPQNMTNVCTECAECAECAAKQMLDDGKWIILLYIQCRSGTAANWIINVAVGTEVPVQLLSNDITHRFLFIKNRSINREKQINLGKGKHCELCKRAQK
jgi:hypothetical protein